MKPTSATEAAFAEALRAAYAALAPGAAERFPAAPDWEPQTADVGTVKGASDQTLKAPVPRVPTVPSENQDRQQRTGGPNAGDAWAEWQERAAIREYDGDMVRAEAEALTGMELGPCPAPPRGWDG